MYTFKALRDIRASETLCIDYKLYVNSGFCIPVQSTGHGNCQAYGDEPFHYNSFCFPIGGGRVGEAGVWR